MNNFTDESYAAFEKAAIEKYDFSTCQRPDGSKYGSPGRCIKGSETTPASKDDKKSSSKASGGGGVSDAQADALSKDLTRQIGEAAKKGDKKAVDNLMLAKSTVDGQIKARAAASGGGGVTATPGNAAKTKAASEKLKADKKAGGGVRQDRKEEAKRKEGNKAQKERDAKRQSNVNVNKALESGNKTQLRKAQADIGGKIAKLEAAGKPVPKSLRATSKLLRDKLES